MLERIKFHTKRTLGKLGIQVAGSGKFGINLWHDIARLSVPMNIIIDVGANIGQWATNCRLENPHAKIFSVEPEPVAYKKLCTTFMADNRHQAFNFALSNEPGTGLLQISEFPTMHSLENSTIKNVVGNVEIQKRTYDTMMKDLQIDHVSMLKVDIEGHELAMFEGAQDSLTNGRIDTIYVEAGFLEGGFTPFCKLERQFFQHGYLFLTLYDLVPKDGFAQARRCDALFVRRGIRLQY